jgi:RNA polymerase sigma factor (sigma-70 family)
MQTGPTMGSNDWLAERFEATRPHLRSVAFRMLGSSSEADDAVQEAWLRVSRAGVDGVENLGGWLTTIVGRVCLDMLRSRRSRGEEPVPEPPSGVEADVPDPEAEALLGESVGLALLVVLETLAPAERVAFVLHDLFGVPFEEIGPIVSRSPAAARQLASRARRRVRGARADPDERRQRAVVDAFLAASREGDFEALLAVLDPEVVARSDGAGVLNGAAETVGAEAVARIFVGRAKAARPALVDGRPGLAWLQGGQVRVAFAFVVEGERVTSIDLIADPDRIRELDVVLV